MSESEDHMLLEKVEEIRTRNREERVFILITDEEGSTVCDDPGVLRDRSPMVNCFQLHSECSILAFLSPNYFASVHILLYIFRIQQSQISDICTAKFNSYSALTSLV